MRLRGPVAAALLAAAMCAAGSAATAQAQIAWAPCGDSNDYACGHLTVALDPSGATPGTITLAMRRHRAPVGEAHEAVIALAGGPGQAAIPFSEQFARLLGPIAATRDLIVFDQRGIGLSHPLSCHRFELDAGGPAGAQLAECAAQIGPTRSDYTTAQTVADIEAIRQAGGYQKLVLYGTSYGTKVAERYAQTYPNRVAALVLDSVVPPNGPEPLNLPTFAAIPRVLSELCAHGGCARITPDPVADVAKLVHRLGAGAMSAHWIDGEGRSHTLRFSSEEVLSILIAGDLEPVLRTEFPAAIRSAANGDGAPFARLLRDAAERGGSAEEESPSESFDTPLYFATSCEEELFPWSRASSPQKRLAEARAAIGRSPAGSFAPFTRENALGISDIPACAFWPFTSLAPAPVTAPLPSVPTLILSGAEDLRTPTSGAREVAAQILGSNLVVVPEVGHSVLGSDFSGCANRALQALFKPAPIKPCTGGPQLQNLLGLAPLAPARLSDVAPAPGAGGRPGRTLRAVELTLADLTRQEIVHALGGLGLENQLSFGGLRTGWAHATSKALTVHDYSYVPGVLVSGEVREGAAVLRISGSAGAHGVLRLRAHQALSGTLGGRRVSSGRSLDLGAVSTAIVRLDAQASHPIAPGGSAVRPLARKLARLLARLSA
ncbi:MAG TPA: alpha/beta fold hydrolase [Solirubrobacteraceae bacterium]|jgi:pimeloyl-ACP methyl ester carboxylesterase